MLFVCKHQHPASDIRHLLIYCCRSLNYCTLNQSDVPRNSPNTGVKEIDQAVAACYSLVKDCYSPINNSYRAINNCYSPIKECYSPIKDCYGTIKDSDSAIKDCYGAIKECYSLVNNSYSPVKDCYGAVNLFDRAIKVFDRVVKDFDGAVAELERSLAPCHHARTRALRCTAQARNASLSLALRPLNLRRRLAREAFKIMAKDNDERRHAIEASG